MIFRFKGNQSDMEVMSDKSYQTLKKVKASRSDEVTIRIPRYKLELMQNLVGKKATKEQLLLAFINNNLKA